MNKKEYEERMTKLERELNISIISAHSPSIFTK